MHHRFYRLATALALGLPMLVLAQGRSDPADPKAPARPLNHASAFADYQPFQDIAPGDWRRLNDALGGSALKRDNAGTPAAPASAQPASAPARTMPMGDMPMHHMPRKDMGMPVQRQPMNGGQK